MTRATVHDVTLFAGPCDGRTISVVDGMAWTSVEWMQGQPYEIYVRREESGRFQWQADRVPPITFNQP